MNNCFFCFENENKMKSVAQQLFLCCRRHPSLWLLIRIFFFYPSAYELTIIIILITRQTSHSTPFFSIVRLYLYNMLSTSVQYTYKYYNTISRRASVPIRYIILYVLRGKRKICRYSVNYDKQIYQVPTKKIEFL